MADDIWADDAISATLGEVGLTAGADADLPDDVRFVRRVRELLEASVAHRGPLSAPAVYVYAPASDRLPGGTTFRPRIHTGEIDPAGQIWFVGSAVRSGHCVSLVHQSSAEIFEFCRDLGFGDVPAIYCDTMGPSPLFAWYPFGLARADEVIEGPIARTAAPTLDDLVDVVDRVHRTRLMTRFNQNVDTSLWEQPSSHWAHNRAEKRVQDALMAGLGGAFGRPYFVEQERTGDAGRFDIGFRESVGGGTSTLRAILELKVAKTFGSSGSPVSAQANEDHIIGGVDQSSAYAEEHEVRDAACFVFDLRKVEAQDESEAARSRATQLGVVLRFWRCFPTAEDYRTFTLPPRR